MIGPFIWFAIGLVLLIGGAELLVRYVSRLALLLGIPKLVIGLTVVAFGTSAPELAVSIQAGINGETDLMLGNIVGSNISNTLFILGIASLFIPLKVHKNLIKKDVPIMLGITLSVYVFALSGNITFWECLALTGMLIGYLLFLSRQRGSVSADIPDEKDEEQDGILKPSLFSLLGLVMLVVGARWMVQSALEIAVIAGVSELVIGLSVVAIGTSLPEVVVTLVAAVKGERDIAAGGVVGSNILNLAAVLGLSGLFAHGSIPVQDSLITFDLPVLIAVSILCFPIFYTGHKIIRWEGAMFLFFYLSYLVYLFLNASEHPLLNIFVLIMLFFVIPLAVLTVLTVAVTEWIRRMKYAGIFKSDKKN